MTLDEAIKHAEEVADQLEESAMRLDITVEQAGCYSCAKEHRQLAKWLKELKKYREKDQWIPTAERLPEKEEKNYWVCLNNGHQCQCRWLNIKHIFSDVKTDDWHWSVTDTDPFSKVIAWMPLPAVYREDNENV